MRYSKFFALVTLLFSPITFADSDSEDITIKNIATGWGREAIYISPNENVTLKEGCSQRLYAIGASNPWVDKMLSIALSAQQTESKVRFRLSGCLGSRMNVKAITIMK